jgi:N-acetylmuramoyl-L-alanine amidase
MKKIIAVLMLFTLLFFSSTTAFAQTGKTKISSNKVYLKDIKFTRGSTQDKVVLYSSNYKGYKVSYLPNPDRIIIDIPNNFITLKGSQLIMNSSVVKNIRYSQFTKSAARVVLDVKGKPGYNIDEKSGSLIFILNKPTAPIQPNTVKIAETSRGDSDRSIPESHPVPENPSYRNIIYHNYKNRIYFTLAGAKLTEVVSNTAVEGSTGEAGESTVSGTADGATTEAAGIKDLFSKSYDTSGKRYTLSFPSSLADIGSGIMQVNDGVINSVEIVSNIENQTTQISFNATDKFEYAIISDPNTNDTEITVLKPYAKNDKLVVIDPGHGGADTGAKYAGVEEKNLNLKIALKLNDILKSKGVNTYMTREDDTFIPLYDRANIANNLNATLFLSIHNNAFNTSECGTETLFYPGDKGREFAQIVQDSLVAALGTDNKGIIERPNLVVLHATKMSAALAEIAYITNTADRSKLMDDEFLQKAASALSDAILKALN